MFLTKNGALNKTEAWLWYTHLRGVTLTSENPRAPYFVSCDMEFARYLQASHNEAVFHLWGGHARADYFVAMLAGKSDYKIVMHAKRTKTFGFEDYLGVRGILPAIDTDVPDECYVFERKQYAILH
jgi:hypothetical protein